MIIDAGGNQRAGEANEDQLPRPSAARSVDELSEMSSSRGRLYVGPGGTLYQGQPIKSGKVENSSPESSRNEEDLAEENERLLQLLNDEEVQLIASGMQEYPEFVDDVIGLFLRHESIFLVCLIIQALLTIFFDVLSLLYRGETLREMRAIYGGLEEERAALIFWIFFAIDISFCLFYFPIGFYGVCRRSVKHYNWFTTLCLVGIFCQMLLAYINKFNLLIFFLLILSYVYARFLCSLLTSLLLLPR